MRGEHLLITGSGRCGTGYIARVLNRAGLACGHESVYGLTVGEWGEFEVEASWLGAAHLPIDGVRVAHQTRDPIKVIRSLVASRLFESGVFDEYSEVAYNRFPHLRQIEDQVETAVQFWLDWTTHADAWAETRWKVEEFPVEKIAAFVGRKEEAIRAEVDSVPTDFNSRPSVAVEFGHVPARLMERLADQARFYGYEVAVPC